MATIVNSFDAATADPRASQTLHSSQQQQPPQQGLFTCLACLVAFRAAEQQRAHYRSDWHRYNLKRKVADLPPLSADAFVVRVHAQQAKQQLEAEKTELVYECTTCSKKYSSENAYNNHLSSSKHKENELKRGNASSKEIATSGADSAKTNSAAAAAAARVPAPTTLPTASKNAVNDDTATGGKKESGDINSQIYQYDAQFKRKVMAATSDDELVELMKLKMEEVPRLTDRDCLFCTHRSKDLERNLQHMSKSHSFFLPRPDLLVDLAGLVAYLQTKVAVANICLYCNGRGRAMHSLEAVRKHMLDKGHCKIDLDQDLTENKGRNSETVDRDEEDEEEMMDEEEEEESEYAEYYDFSGTGGWEDVDDDAEEDWMEVEEDGGNGEEANANTGSSSSSSVAVHAVAPATDDQAEMTLPNASGKRIGHRSFARYWKQRVPLEEKTRGYGGGRNRDVVKALMAQYRSMGHVVHGGGDSQGRELLLHGVSGSGQMSMTAEQMQLMVAVTSQERREKQRQARESEVQRRERDARIGVKGNDVLLKHFRRQNPI